MSDKLPARSEADLRAAFTLAAQDAPATDEVLARLAAAQRPVPAAARRPAVRRWAPIAATAAIVIAIGVPIGFAVSSSNNGTRSSSSSLSVGDAKAAASAPAAGAASSAAAGIVPNYTLPSGAAGICTPSQLALTLTWTQSGRGLVGALRATNTTSAACDLAVKPSIYPLDSSGKRLPVQNAVSAEGYAGPARLLAGASATSSLSWSSWCGAKASDQAEVDWNTGPAKVTVSGPSTPSCVKNGATNISSNWFTPLS